MLQRWASFCWTCLGHLWSPSRTVLTVSICAGGGLGDRRDGDHPARSLEGTRGNSKRSVQGGAQAGSHRQCHLPYHPGMCSPCHAPMPSACSPRCCPMQQIATDVWLVCDGIGHLTLSSCAGSAGRAGGGAGHRLPAAASGRARGGRHGRAQRHPGAECPLPLLLCWMSSSAAGRLKELRSCSTAQTS